MKTNIMKLDKCESVKIETELQNLILDLAKQIESGSITKEQILEKLTFHILPIVPPKYNTTLHAPRMITG